MAYIHNIEMERSQQKIWGRNRDRGCRTKRDFLLKHFGLDKRDTSYILIISFPRSCERMAEDCQLVKRARKKEAPRERKAVVTP
ncbi:MAG: hypothetical protein DRG82_03345 [Deltaproteobacteria bacterium]|nr:MAG: hypothetical protein DRG82_03345 [Deltaproteobacteria bacterium]